MAGRNTSNNARCDMNGGYISVRTMGLGHRVIRDKYGDSAPKLETDTELGVKQVVEKQEEVSLIRDEPSCGVRVEDRDGTEADAYEDNDASSAQEIELGQMDNRCGHGTAAKDDLEESVKNREAKPEQYNDQISICSLD